MILPDLDPADIRPPQPRVLITVQTEFLAALIVARLEAEGISAQALGGITSGFKAEAPGGVKILVPHADFAKAKDILDQIERKKGDAATDQA